MATKIVSRRKAAEYVRGLPWMMTPERMDRILEKLDSECYLCRFEATLEVWGASDGIGFILIDPFTSGRFCQRHDVWGDIIQQGAIEESKPFDLLDPQRALPELAIAQALEEHDAFTNELEWTIYQGLRDKCPLCRQEARLALLTSTSGQTDARDLSRWSLEDVCEEHQRELKSATEKVAERYPDDVTGN